MELEGADLVTVSPPGVCGLDCPHCPFFPSAGPPARMRTLTPAFECAEWKSQRPRCDFPLDLDAVMGGEGGTTICGTTIRGTTICGLRL